MSKLPLNNSTANFEIDLKWAQQGHLFLAKYFYKHYAYRGQFVYCDRQDKKERGALFIQKKLHIDVIVQKENPFNALCIDEKIVKGYYDAFTLETHSVTPTPQMPKGLGDGCILLSMADILLYCFPTQKDCRCVPLSGDWQKCTHSIRAMRLYIINLCLLQQWFREVYQDYSWRAIPNKGYWTHVRIVPIVEVYNALGKENIVENFIPSKSAWEERVVYVEPTGQQLLFPFKNELVYFKRQDVQ